MEEAPEEKKQHTNLFTHIYITFANGIISKFVGNGQVEKISRSRIEMQILREVDRSRFPLKYRIALFNMLLNTDTFDIYWVGQQYLYSLSKKAITRIEADMSLVDEVKSPYPIDATESEAEASSATSNSDSQKKLRRGSDSSSSPFASANTDKDGVTDDDSVAAGDTAAASGDDADDDTGSSDENEESVVPQKIELTPGMIPQVSASYSDPATNFFSRFPNRPRPGTTQPTNTAPSSQRSVTPTSESDDDESNGSSRDIPIDPLLTTGNNVPTATDTRPSPPAESPASKRAAKSKEGGILSGANGSNDNTKKRKAVRFDLPDEEFNNNAGNDEDDEPPASPAKKARTSRAARGKGTRGTGTSTRGKTAPRGSTRTRKTTTEKESQ